MAFKGGFLVKPTTTNTQNLANLLIQGTQAIEDKKLKVGEIASNLVKETNKTIAEIPITGPADHPVLVQKASNAIRNYLSDAYKRFTDGEISLSELKTINSKAYSQATMFSKSQELAAKQNEDLKKGIAEGKYSGIANSMNYGIYRTSSTGDNNESALDVFVDDFGDIQLTQSILMPTLDGLEKRSVPVSKTANLTQRLSPANGFIPPLAVDIEDDVKTFVGNIKSSGFVTAELIDEEDEKGNLTGNKISVVKVNPGQDKNVRDGIELAIVSYQPEDFFDIAHKFGMKTDMDRTYRPYTQERINSRFTNLSIDADGNAISISPEDMLIKTSDDGLSLDLTEKQVDILEGFVRKKLYTAIDPQLKIFRDKDVASGTKKLTISEQAKAAPLTSAVYDREALVEATLDQQNRYNVFAPKEKQTTPKDGEYIIHDDKLQALLSNSKSEVSSYSIDSRLHEPLAELLNESSFFDSRLDTINSYAVIKDSEGEFNLVFIGGANIGKSKTTQGEQGVIERETETSDYTNEAISGIASDQQAKTFYQFMYNNNDNFRTLAENRSFVLDEEDYMTALAVLSEASLLMPK